MISPALKKTVFLSIAGHFTLFSLFSFSFGNKILSPDYSPISFWGQILPSAQINQILPAAAIYYGRIFAGRREALSMANRFKSSDMPAIPDYYLKPHSAPVFDIQKAGFGGKTTPFVYPKRKEAAIVFHPLLPLNFRLYFRDRQIAHVELMFKRTSGDGQDYIEIKRKISSGNLDVDLFVMRYMGHYLFIQQPKLLPGDWQAVKIDLSAKND